MKVKKLFSRRPSVEKLLEARDVDGLTDILSRGEYPELKQDAIAALRDLCNSGTLLAGSRLSEGGRRAIDALALQLHTSDRSRRAVATEALLALEPLPCRLAVIEAVKSHAGWKDEWLQIMSQLIQDQDAKVRIAAVWSFDRLSVSHWRTEYAEPLVAVMREEGRLGVEAARVLCGLFLQYVPGSMKRYWKPAFGASLLDALLDCPEAVRRVVLEAFGEHVTSWDYAREVVATMFRDEQKSFRLAAIEVYGKAFDTNIFLDAASLIDLLQDADAEIRLGAIDQLRKSALVEAVEPLAALAGSDREDVRLAAESAIEEIQARKGNFEEFVRNPPKEVQEIHRRVAKSMADWLEKEGEEMRRAWESDGGGQSPYHR